MPNNGNGKGDKPRSGANNSAYWQNYDDIFRRSKGEKAAADVRERMNSYTREQRDELFEKAKELIGEGPYFDVPNPESTIDPNRNFETAKQKLLESLKRKPLLMTLEEVEESKLDSLP